MPIQPPEETFCNLDTPPGLPVAQLYVLPSFFLVVLLLGLPLNLLSLWVFSHQLKRWTRSTVFLFNLTLADTSWLLALPLLFHYHLDGVYWRLGLPLCKAVRMLYHNYFYLSIFFVTCISVDRYLAIVHPLRSVALLSRTADLPAVCGSLDGHSGPQHTCCHHDSYSDLPWEQPHHMYFVRSAK